MIQFVLLADSIKIAWSYFQSLLNDEKKAIFINVNDKKIRKNFVFNVNVFELKKNY